MIKRNLGREEGWGDYLKREGVLPRLYMLQPKFTNDEANMHT